MRNNLYKDLPPLERRPDGSLYRMTPAQRKQAASLIRRECCCCEDGNCIVLDDGDTCTCPQTISFSVCCKWFRWAVLPLDGTLIQAVIGDIMRNVPVGFAHHKLGIPSYTMDRALEELNLYEEDTELLGQLEAGYFQIGTLGGGNHFIELQEDDQGMLAVMIHSGSRHFGKSVCDYFHYKARQLNQKWYSQVPDEYRLAFLPVDSPEGRQYLRWMQLSMDFAKENREKMMLAVKAILEKYIGKYTELDLKFSGDITQSCKPSWQVRTDT